MTDKELLEKAAHIAGAKLNRSLDMWVIQQQDGVWIEWNPLQDDGDALRLAVKLNLQITIEDDRCGSVTVSWGDYENDCVIEYPSKSIHAAASTRRAITRAAASLADQ